MSAKAAAEKDRHSRSGKDDRAKKGGKGGAFTWEGDGSEDGPAVLDKVVLRCQGGLAPFVLSDLYGAGGAGPTGNGYLVSQQ